LFLDEDVRDRRQRLDVVRIVPEGVLVGDGGLVRLIHRIAYRACAHTAGGAGKNKTVTHESSCLCHVRRAKPGPVHLSGANGGIIREIRDAARRSGGARGVNLCCRHTTCSTLHKSGRKLNKCGTEGAGRGQTYLDPARFVGCGEHLCDWLATAWFDQLGHLPLLDRGHWHRPRCFTSDTPFPLFKMARYLAGTPGPARRLCTPSPARPIWPVVAQVWSVWSPRVFPSQALGDPTRNLSFFSRSRISEIIQFWKVD
jgi:hypothetical protein